MRLLEQIAVRLNAGPGLSTGVAGRDDVEGRALPRGWIDESRPGILRHLTATGVAASIAAMTAPMDWLHTGVALQGGIARDVFAELGGRELQPGDRLGPFAISAELGRGGMSIVYAAERADGEFEQEVAIKWIAGGGESDQAAALFRRERQILASLRHPNIARLLDGGRTEDGMLWFAMERIEGLRLDHHLAAGRDASWNERLDLLRQICAALTFAHGRGLVHRDLKPGNIAVDADGSVKLLDFGIALWAEHNPDSLRQAYTPAWASPEQLRGEITGPASDIYQLGRLLRWLSGEAPTGATPILAAPGRRRLELDAIVDRACADVPEARYGSVSEFKRDLGAWQQQRPVTAYGAGSGYRLRLFLRRNAIASALVAAALALLVVLSAGFTWRLQQERDHALAQAARANAAREFLVSLFRGADPTARQGLNLTARDLLDRGEARLDTELNDQPQLRADLQETLASVYNFLAEHERAGHLIRAALASTPDDDDDTTRLDRARRLLLLASVHNRARESTQAIEHTDAVLAELRGLQGPAALELELSALNARAMAYKYLQRSTEAAQALERLLSRVEASANASSHRAYAADNLAHLYELQGRWPQALEQAAVAEQAFLSLRGNDSPEPWAVASYRASLEYATGDLAAARSRYQDVLVAFERIYERNDRRLMNTRTALARVALAQDDVPAASTLIDTAWASCKEQFSGDHGQCPLTLQLRGELQARNGDAAAAIPTLREAVQLRQSEASPLPRAVALAQLALAQVLCRQRNVDEGRSLLAQAEQQLRATEAAPRDRHVQTQVEADCHE